MQIPIPNYQAMTRLADCSLRLMPSLSPDFAILAHAMAIQLMLMLVDCCKACCAKL